VATQFYNSFKQKGYDSSTKIDLASDTIKCALVTSTYTPNIDTHDFFDDITNEVTGTGYTAGGATLATKTWTLNTALDKMVFDADDASWPASTITARYAVLYKDTGTPSTSPLIMIFDFGVNQSSAASEFKIVWNSGGIFELAQAA